MRNVRETLRVEIQYVGRKAPSHSYVFYILSLLSSFVIQNLDNIFYDLFTNEAHISITKLRLVDLMIVYGHHLEQGFLANFSPTRFSHALAYKHTRARDEAIPQQYQLHKINGNCPVLDL